MERQTISIMKACELVGVSRRTIYNWIAAGKVDLKPLVSDTFDFGQSIKAFERAAEGRPGDVKLQIVLGGETN